MDKIIVKSGCKTFEAEIYKNEVAVEFLRKLPLTLKLEKDDREYFSPVVPQLYGKEKKHRHFTAGDIAVCNTASVSVFVNQATPKKHFVKVGHICNPEFLEYMIEMNNGFVTFDLLDEPLCASA